MKTPNDNNNQKNNQSRLSILLVMLSVMILGCDSFVDIDPPKTELVSATIYEDNLTAKAVMDGVYSRMMGSLGYASGFANSITIKHGLTSDELVANVPNDPFYDNQVLPSNADLATYFWQEPYQYIYTVNSLLEGLKVSEGVSETVKQQLQGEALFIRAFCYFYLLNDFGDVPLHLSTDYQKNLQSARSSQSLVYERIINDLTQAETLLDLTYEVSSGERIRPTKWAATALLARVYLYTEQWGLASDKATQLLANTTLFELQTDLTKVFLKNSKEAVWQLMPVRPNFNTMEGYRFIPSGSTVSSETVSANLLATFELGDLRQTHWLKSLSNGGNTWVYPFKYKVRLSATLQEYSMVLRLAEQYLIRAEAKAQQNDLAGALNDLNTLRTRAGLPLSTAVTQADVLLAIYKERRLELFAEWGHRWYDLKRTGRMEAVLSAQKPNWESSASLYPIPETEVLRNPNITQNAGY